MMKLLAQFICFSLLCIGCADKGPRSVVSNQTAPRNPYENIIAVRQYGDSLRIEIEKTPAGIIKHYIDLKGTTDDNFDDSYNVICTYAEYKNDTSVKNCFKILSGKYRFCFDRKEVLAYSDSMKKADASNADFYQNLRLQVYGKTNTMYLYQDADLIQHLRFRVKDSLGNDVRSVLVEHYKTEFSGGENFYVIGAKGDTTLLFHKMGYIN